MHTHRQAGPSELPSYPSSFSNSARSSFSRTRSPVEHAFSLFNRRERPWTTLKVTSNAVSPKYLPSYFEGQPIVGTVSLDLCKVETIQSISITLSGEIVATNVEPVIFLESRRVLWATEMGDPSTPNISGSPQPKHSGKLQGKYCWDFSLQIPSTCTISLPPKSAPRTLPLPPSFSEKGATQYINYELYVWIQRGPLRIDSKLGTYFGYSPRIRPRPPSMLRQIAYREHSPLTGPDGDPDGWEISPSLPVRGKLFDRCNVHATCTFALAQPLCYTRGSAIPCSLTLSCQNVQAADLLSHYSAPQVSLLRTVNYGADKQSGNGIKQQTLKHATTEISKAVWWPTKDGDHGDGNRRRLDGEIHLPRDLQPSFDFGPFSIKYEVVMHPFTAPGYVDLERARLMSKRVDIATVHATGPSPKAYAPPGYEHMKQRPMTYGLYTTVS